MKRLLFLSLLMMQGLWGAGAAHGVQPQVVNKVPSLKELILQSLLRNPNSDIKNARGEDFSQLLTTVYSNNVSRLMRDLYVAWLNANPTQSIVVRQTAQNVCAVMGIVNVPAEWQELIVDVSDYLRHGITSLETRPGTIAHLVANNRMPVPQNGILNLSHRNLGVFDVWNILNRDSLTALSLYNNQLTTLAPGTFAGLSSLQGLDLSHNQLATLAPGTFEGLISLYDLYLSHNQLAALASGAFNGLGALEALDMSYNQLTALAPGVFAGLSALQRLYIFNNQLTALVLGAFEGLGALETLLLSHNQLTMVLPGAFAGLRYLENLSLNNNKLATLAAGTFAGLSSLRYLYLSDNQLATLVPGVFCGLDSLLVLNLENNENLGLVDSDRLNSIKRQHPKWFKIPWSAEAACAIQ